MCRKVARGQTGLFLDYLLLSIALIATQCNTWGILVLHFIFEDIVEMGEVVLVN